MKLCPETTCPDWGSADECTHGVPHTEQWDTDDKGHFSYCDVSCLRRDQWGYLTRCHVVKARERVTA